MSPNIQKSSANAFQIDYSAKEFIKIIGDFGPIILQNSLCMKISFIPVFFVER